MGTLLSIIIALVVGGVIWYIVQILLSMVPIDARLKQIANALIALFVFLWILSLVGIWDPGVYFGYHRAVIVR